jgi:hypothetical protein
MTGMSNLAMNSFRLRGSDHQHVQLGIEDQLRESPDLLGGEGGRRYQPSLLDLPNPPGDQLLLDGLLIQLLHPAGGLLVGERRDLVEHRLGVLVSGL